MPAPKAKIEIPPLPEAKPEAPHALSDLKTEIQTRGMDSVLQEIDQDPNANQFERMAKKIAALATIYEITMEGLREKVDEFLGKLGLKEEDVEMYLPGPGEPPEEHYADAVEGNVPMEKIKPSEEADIFALLGERTHVDEKGVKKTWFEIAQKACKKFGVPLIVLLAIIRRESGFKTDKYTYNDPLKGKPASSARGLGQFLFGDWYGVTEKQWNAGRRGTRGFLNAPPDENPWNGAADRLNPEHAIWATARHIRNKVREVNNLVAQGAFPVHFRLNLTNAGPEDVKWIYMSYMNGSLGYCLLRQYIENPSAANYEKLTKFQKRGALYRNTATGEIVEFKPWEIQPTEKGWKRLRLSHIEAAKKCANGGIATAKAYYEQILTKNPSLLAEQFAAIENPNEPFMKCVDDEGHETLIRQTVAKAFQEARAVAKKIGVERGMKIKLVITSGYRDEKEQERIFAESEKKRGADVEKWAARPGQSNHHSGGAIDVYAYERRPGGDWIKNQQLLKEILPRVGFVNYEFEDWHWEIGTQRWAERLNISSPIYAKVFDRSKLTLA